ncbi:YdbT family protein [Aminipila terrae]|uniref:PH domain-containing protein n=1 Tax=Aminipila terrae TaxID=2697030 RepID=A0A6P1MR29_9FIRM|nr:hypothetical protein [Aminipila terrae]QHI73455.1 hypothetical protein Ami3637_14680 [Aminipila terrae]
MRKYYYKIYIHLISALSFLLGIVFFILITDDNRRISDYFLLVISTIALFAFVDNILTFYEVNNERVVLKSLTRKISITFTEVQCIVEQPAGKLVGRSIGVFGKDNHRKILITAWTRNYEELVGVVVKKYIEMKHDNIDNVDVRVLELVKYKE